MSRRRGEESCPFLDGVYVSVMRRFASTSFFSSKNWESMTFKKDNKPRLPQAALVRGGAYADNNSPSRQVGFVESNDSLFHRQHFCHFFLVIRCTLLVEETIPRGAFVDPDEMRDLRFISNIF